MYKLFLAITLVIPLSILLWASTVKICLNNYQEYHYNGCGLSIDDDIQLVWTDLKN